jgi:hypothetical protein
VVPIPGSPRYLVSRLEHGHQQQRVFRRGELAPSSGILRDDSAGKIGCPLVRGQLVKRCNKEGEGFLPRLRAKRQGRRFLAEPCVQAFALLLSSRHNEVGAHRWIGDPRPSGPELSEVACPFRVLAEAKREPDVHARGQFEPRIQAVGVIGPYLAPEVFSFS